MPTLFIRNDHLARHIDNTNHPPPSYLAMAKSSRKRGSQRGVSNKVKVSYGTANTLRTPVLKTKLRLNESAERKRLNRLWMEKNMASTGFNERDALVGDGGMNDDDGWEPDEPNPLDSAMRTIPPGEEGMFLSNAGSEVDVLHELVQQAVRPT